MCTSDDYRNLRLCYQHRPLVQQELGLWHEMYLPVKKNVLDGGAGCGETVQFYLNHGAEKVLAIECDPECLTNLKTNFGTDPRVEIVDFQIGSIKLDVEGAERDMVFEAHFPYRVKRLAGFNYSTVSLNRLEEYWGSPVTKGKRLLAKWLLK